MDALVIAGIAFGCIALGVVLGMLLRNILPDHHLSSDAKDVVRLGTGLIGTIAALVLGLLIASAKNAYDVQSGEVKQLTADVILLDNVLSEYGAEADQARVLIRRGLGVLADRMWRRSGFDETNVPPFEASAVTEQLYQQFRKLSPKDEAQRSLQARAIELGSNIAKTRLLLYTQSTNSIPMPFLAVLIFWLSIIFASFSLFAKPNAIVVASLFIFAISAAGSIYLIIELGQPFSGLMRISSEPLRNALPPLPMAQSSCTAGQNC